jgi:hypothetical protein
MKLFDTVDGGVELAESRVVLELCNHTRARKKSHTRAVAARHEHDRRAVAGSQGRGEEAQPRSTYRVYHPLSRRTPTGVRPSPRRSGPRRWRTPPARPRPGPTLPHRRRRRSRRHCRPRRPPFLPHARVGLAAACTDGGATGRESRKAWSRSGEGGFGEGFSLLTSHNSSGSSVR